MDLTEPIVRNFREKKVGSVQYTSHSIVSCGYICAAGGTGWMVATELLEKEYFQEYNNVRSVLLISSAIAFGVILVLLALISEGLIAPPKKLAIAASQIAEGNLDMETSVHSQDEIGHLGGTFNQTIFQSSSYRGYIQEITDTLETMVSGDMRTHPQREYAGEFAPVKQALLDISSSLCTTLSSIDEVATQTNSSVEQIPSAAQVLAAGATQQAASVEELSSMTVRIDESTRENVKNVENTVAVYEQSNQKSKSINHSVELFEGRTGKISHLSTTIMGVTRTIEDIALQTDILALNAAIEAACTGMAGKGPTVVADKIRNLATKPAEAVKQTAELLTKSNQAVEFGASAVDEASGSIQAVIELGNRVNEAVVGVGQSAQEQVRMVNQISEGLSQISAVVQTNTATAKESSAPSIELLGQAGTLHQEIRKFQLYDQEELSVPSDGYSDMDFDSFEGF